MNFRSHVVIAALALTACATPPTGKYPDFKSVPTISVSSATLSTWTETPAEDHLIPDSQVFVSGRGVSGNWFGLLGTAIDRSRNEAAAEQAASSFTIKFHQNLTGALRKHATKEPYAAAVQIIEPDAAADVQLRPYARFRVRKDQRADLSLQIATRFTDALQGAGTKRYFYTMANVRPLAGSAESWSDNQGKAFRQAAELALDRLALVFLRDLRGEFRQALDSDKPRLLRYQPLDGEVVVNLIILDEQPEYVVVVPVYREQPIRTYVYMIERAAIAMETK